MTSAAVARPRLYRMSMICLSRRDSAWGAAFVICYFNNSNAREITCQEEKGSGCLVLGAGFEEGSGCWVRNGAVHRRVLANRGQKTLGGTKHQRLFTQHLGGAGLLYNQ